MNEIILQGKIFPESIGPEYWKDGSSFMFLTLCYMEKIFLRGEASQKHNMWSVRN